VAVDGNVKIEEISDLVESGTELFALHQDAFADSSKLADLIEKGLAARSA
jgi:hypothetical protein